MPIVLMSRSLNFLEPSGPVQASNGIPLPLLLHIVLCRLLNSTVQRTSLCQIIGALKIADNMSQNLQNIPPHISVIFMQRLHICFQHLMALKPIFCTLCAHLTSVTFMNCEECSHIWPKFLS